MSTPAFTLAPTFILIELRALQRDMARMRDEAASHRDRARGTAEFSLQQGQYEAWKEAASLEHG
jgi:hypothetical protein